MDQNMLRIPLAYPSSSNEQAERAVQICKEGLKRSSKGSLGTKIQVARYTVLKQPGVTKLWFNIHW